MLTLLKNLECYNPKKIGKNDILICNNKIYKIEPAIKCTDKELFEQIIDCDGLYAFPAFIDQHIHITGGGGEDGFQSHIPEIETERIFEAGVATIVGLLGADSCMRSLTSLYAKAKALEAGGLTTYIYSGSYSVPPVTFTGDIVSDLVLIDKVIGIGEIALSDHRSTTRGTEELFNISAEAHLGGLLSGKAGVVHLHMGDGKQGLSPLFQLLHEADLPAEQFVPTHVNRNQKLFEQAIDYCKIGGNIDLTSGEAAGISVLDAIEWILTEGINIEQVTVSSDANGSIPDGGVSSIDTLFNDIIGCIKNKKISPEIAISLVTENVAKRLKLYPQKGTLTIGSDADIMIADKDFNIKKLYCMGKLCFEKK